MKNLLCGLAAICLTFACATEERASFEEGLPGTVEAAECSTEIEEAAECSSAKAAECSAEKAAECEAKKEACPTTGVCPMTGQVE